MNKTILTHPFAPELIKQRPGSHGKTLHYVDVASVVSRLNDGCDAWDFFIDKYEVHDEEVLVQGRIVADGVTKCAFGGSSVTADKQGKVVSIPDDLKSAASDALKKCASLLGVGLELYGGQPQPRPTARTNTRSTTPRPTPETTTAPAPAPRAVTTSPTPTSSSERSTARQAVPAEDPSERATVRQLAAIHSASRRRGYSRETLAHFLGEMTGKRDLSHLSRDEASQVITGLNEAGAH